MAPFSDRGEWMPRREISNGVCMIARWQSLVQKSIFPFRTNYLMRWNWWGVKDGKYIFVKEFYLLECWRLSYKSSQYRVSGVHTSSLSTHSYKYLSSKFFFLHKNIQSFISRWNQLETVEIIIIYFSSWIIVCFFSFSFSPSLFVIALKLIYIRAKLSADYI